MDPTTFFQLYAVTGLFAGFMAVLAVRGVWHRQEVQREAFAKRIRGHQ